MKEKRSPFPDSVFLRFAIVWAISLSLSGCALFGSSGKGIAVSPEDWKARSNEPLTTLADYYLKHGDIPRSSDLIACAAGGYQNMMSGELAPVSVFFYPKDNASDIRIFEAPSIQTDTLDWASFHEMRWPIEPVFNGYLRRYVTDYLQKETWLVVTCLTDDTLHTSRMIHLKIANQPTIIDTGGIVAKPGSSTVLFHWEGDSTSADITPPVVNDAIYFEVVSDKDGNLISGTYTRNPQFEFYNTENVVINIRDIDPPPTLKSRRKYDFMVMAVSADNWVNRILKLGFVAP